MIFDALAGVVRAGARAEDERPVAGLGQQQLAAGLLERAPFEIAWCGETVRQLGHSFLGHLQVRVNPFVGLVEPDLPVAFLAPARSARAADLLRRLAAELIHRRGEREEFRLVIRGHRFTALDSL